MREPDDFYELLGLYDTVLCMSLLEGLPDDAEAVRQMRGALREDGRLILRVPQNPALFGSLDVASGHRRRYTPAGLRGLLENAGFRVEALLEFNRATTPAWWLASRVLRRRGFGGLALWLVERAIPLLRHLDRWLSWHGASLIAVARIARQ